jgi:hypothetical protein
MSDIPAAKPQALRSIYMYRMIQGNKVRWKFEVDNQMVIVNEGPAEVQESSVQKSDAVPGPRPVAVPPDAVAQYKKILEERGIKYSMTTEGQVVINEIPNKEKVIMQFFDLNAPCPEGLGLEPVRERYKQEYDQAGGAACPACQLNTLQRKYRAILQEKIPNG